MINEAEYKEWLEMPVTKAFRQLLRAKRQELKDEWEAGRFTGLTAEETGQKSIAAMHESKAYSLVLDIDYTDFINEAEGEQGGK